MILDGIFTVIHERSNADEVTVICEQPNCNDQSGNRSFNLKTGKTNCWRCNVGGEALSYLRQLGHEPNMEDVQLYDASTLDEASADLDTYETSRRSVVAYTNTLTLPRGFTKIEDEPDSGYVRLIERMAKRKNLDLETFIRAGAGFTRTDRLWEPFCIFPVFEWGRLVYYQGRTYTDPKRDPETGKKPSTKKFPSKNEIPLGSRYWIHNIDRLRAPKARVGIVVESMFNAFSLENEMQTDEVVPIAIFKHKISPEQQAKILTAKGIKELVLMFDPDAISASWESCRRLTNVIKVTVAPALPKGVDPNDDVKAAVKSFEQRKQFNSVNSLEHLAAGL